MEIILYLLSLFVIVMGLVTLPEMYGVFQEIAVLLIFLIAAVLLVGGAVVSTIKNKRQGDK